MKVSELKASLESFNDDDSVVIVLDGEDSIGGTPCVNAVSVHGGIDWNSSKCFLKTDAKLFRPTSDIEENRRIRQAVLEYLWDKKDKKPSFHTKEFLEAFNVIPNWFKGEQA